MELEVEDNLLEQNQRNTLVIDDEINSFISNDPDTDNDSFTRSLSSSFFVCVWDKYFQRFLPADFVGKTKRGITSMPINESLISILNKAITVVTTVHILEMIFVSVELITFATPEISEFILVMMSPCFSEVKKE